MKEDVAQQSEKLEVFLFDKLNEYNLHLIPDELVRVSALLLIKMFAEYVSEDLIKVVALGSVWAWSFDEIVDNPKTPLAAKMSFIEDYLSICRSWDLKYPKEITKSLPKTSELIIDSLNRLILNFSITELDRKFLFKQVNYCLEGAKFETLNAGKGVDLEQSLKHRAYSYATPLYGTMILVGHHHLRDEHSAQDVEMFLELFGKVTRIRNDLSTFEKEKDGKEINIVSVLMQSGKSQADALLSAKQYYDSTSQEYLSAGKNVPSSFFDVIENFRRVHDSAYEVKDIRTLQTKNLEHI